MSPHKHFVCFPSANPDIGNECLKKWHAKGYDSVVMVDRQDIHVMSTIKMVGDYQRFPGYYKVINAIVGRAFVAGADLVTCIGDDMDPPRQTAQEIADMYFKRWPDGLGVLQGCGDPQGMNQKGESASRRICGSPTFGKGWHQKSFDGHGPFHSGFNSFYGDEILKDVSEKHGLLWMEQSIMIFHRHWSWGHGSIQPYHMANQKSWEVDRSLYFELKERAYPGCGMLG